MAYKVKEEELLSYLPSNIVETELLSKQAKRVLGALHHWILHSRAQETKRIIIGNSGLATIAGVSSDGKNFNGYIDELINYGLIKRKVGKRRTAGEKNQASEYFICWNALEEPLVKVSKDELLADFKRSTGFIDKNSIVQNSIDKNSLDKYRKDKNSIVEISKDKFSKDENIKEENDINNDNIITLKEDFLKPINNNIKEDDGFDFYYKHYYEIDQIKNKKELEELINKIEEDRKIMKPNPNGEHTILLNKLLQEKEEELSPKKEETFVYQDREAMEDARLARQVASQSMFSEPIDDLPF
jgi:hypothetical protein